MTTATANIGKSTETRRTANAGTATDLNTNPPKISPRVLRMLMLLNEDFDSQSPVPE